MCGSLARISLSPSVTHPHLHQSTEIRYIRFVLAVLMSSNAWSEPAVEYNSQLFTLLKCQGYGILKWTWDGFLQHDVFIQYSHILHIPPWLPCPLMPPGCITEKYKLKRQTLRKEEFSIFFFTSNIVSRWHNCAIMNGREAELIKASSLSWAPSTAPLHLKSDTWRPIGVRLPRRTPGCCVVSCIRVLFTLKSVSAEFCRHFLQIN